MSHHFTCGVTNPDTRAWRAAWTRCFALPLSTLPIPIGCLHYFINRLARPLAVLGYLRNQCCFIYERLVKNFSTNTWFRVSRLVRNILYIFCSSRNLFIFTFFLLVDDCFLFTFVIRFVFFSFSFSLCSGGRRFCMRRLRWFTKIIPIPSFLRSRSRCWRNILSL